MTEQMSSRPWSNEIGEPREPVRLSPSDFVTLAHEYLFKIKQIYPHLQRAYTTCSEQNEIAPDECDHLLKILGTLYPPLHSLLELCTDIEHLPLIILPLRRPLLAELSQGKEQIQRLTLLTNTVISAYRVASSRTVRQLCTFMRYLEVVLQISENIFTCSQALFDQVRFLERCQKEK